MINTVFLFTMGTVDTNLWQRLCPQGLLLLVFFEWVMSALFTLDICQFHLLAGRCNLMLFFVFTYFFYLISWSTRGQISCVHTRSIMLFRCFHIIPQACKYCQVDLIGTPPIRILV